MKKISIILFIALLMHGTAFAGGNTLYDISQDTISLVDAYTACADTAAACTEDDARVIQAAGKSLLADLKVLITSGNMQHMMMTADESRSIGERVRSVRERLMTIELFDAPCNQALLLVFVLMDVLQWVAVFPLVLFMIVQPLSPVLQAAVILAGLYFLTVPAVIICIALILASFVLLVPCLFFWL